ncbi:hypothetical protein SDC9_107029 [bioreactor metagenome]|uniref:Uncharacterized protein n=1 Tax=bioreactor metagenome TaxID=1076179 RepID=A0A645B6D8_9ZZZZ
MLHDVADIGQLGDGLVKAAHILDERLNIAHTDAALNGQPAAQNADRHIPKVADKSHQRHHQAG